MDRNRATMKKLRELIKKKNVNRKDMCKDHKRLLKNNNKDKSL
jgi:hypothetical protein